jgi:hypothetical protein
MDYEGWGLLRLAALVWTAEAAVPTIVLCLDWAAVPTLFIFILFSDFRNRVRGLRIAGVGSGS